MIYSRYGNEVKIIKKYDDDDCVRVKYRENDIDDRDVFIMDLRADNGMVEIDAAIEKLKEG